MALFVKTPGLSPVKTRLAVDLGAAQATAVYLASVACVRDAIDAAAQQTALAPYWAVAEPEGASSWPQWPVQTQPAGDLGARMRGIYQSLWQRHGAVLLIGADVPGISAAVIVIAAQALVGAPARVIAPASDGGFVLFGANTDLADAAWSAPAYGAPDTARQFLRHVGAALPLTTLAEHQDLDTLADLHALRLQPPAHPSAAQQAFWALIGQSSP